MSGRAAQVVSNPEACIAAVPRRRLIFVKIAEFPDWQICKIPGIGLKFLTRKMIM